MNNKNDIYVPLTKRSEAIGDYLENEHWTNTSSTDAPNSSRVIDDNGADESDFTHEELQYALKMSKNNKQPGPDSVTMEFLKWLDNDNQKALLVLTNTWWRSKNAPDELFLARVVPIYKR